VGDIQVRHLRPERVTDASASASRRQVGHSGRTYRTRCAPAH
jgi:hypothetical protein